MKEITKYLTIVVHFYNLNQAMTRPLIDIDGEVEVESYTQNIRGHELAIFPNRGFDTIFNCYNMKTKESNGIFIKNLSENVRCKYIYRMLVCPKPSPVLIDDPWRKDSLLGVLQFDRWNEYLLSSWWLHHISVNGIEFNNVWHAKEYAYNLIGKEVEELESEIRDNLWINNFSTTITYVYLNFDGVYKSYLLRNY